MNKSLFLRPFGHILQSSTPALCFFSLGRVYFFLVSTFLICWTHQTSFPLSNGLIFSQFPRDISPTLMPRPWKTIPLFVEPNCARDRGDNYLAGTFILLLIFHSFAELGKGDRPEFRNGGKMSRFKRGLRPRPGIKMEFKLFFWSTLPLSCMILWTVGLGSNLVVKWKAVESQSAHKGPRTECDKWLEMPRATYWSCIWNSRIMNWV